MSKSSKDMFTQKYYKIRPGTTNLGREYEYKMMALLLLRCMKCFDDMWMASNVDGVGAFDDIVLRVRRAGGSTATYLIQLKHKESSKPVAEKDFVSQKGDFSLSKYASDIAKIKEDIQGRPEGVPVDLGKFSDLYFVIFTNSAVNRYAYLEKSSSKNLLFLNTGKGRAGMYKFNVAKMPPSFECDYAEHYTKINFFANQIYAKHLDKYIEEELEKVLNHLQITSIDPKSLTHEFIGYVTNWAKGGLGGYYYLTRSDIVVKLTDALLSYYELDFRSEQLEFDVCDQNLIWSRAIGNKAVTIVDCDEKIIEFLKLYVRSEIQIFCKDFNKTWRHKLSDEAQTLLFHNHSHLKNSLLQLVENHGNITPYGIYKCLWLNKQLSLLLQVSHMDDYQNIHKILTFASSLSLRIIILNMTKHTLRPLSASVSYFLTISDLSDEERAEILKLPVKLQGRSSVILEEVVDESMHNHIKVKDVVDILLEDFNIGVEYEPLPQYYVQRSMFKVLLEFDVLTLKDEFFAIIDNRNVQALKDWGASNIEIIRDVTEIASTPKYTPLHVLHLENTEYLKWVGSFGSTKNILKYKLEDVPYEEVEDVFECECNFNNVRLIGEYPGMGKSTLMNFIAINAPVDTWVLNVALSEYDRYYEHLQQNVKARNYLNYFNEAILKNYHCNNLSLANAVFQKFADRKKVLVLLDGFDEVCFLYKDQVTHIAKCMYSEGYRMWITTRPHMKSHLEEQLCSVALMLRQFTKEDQAKFLIKYFLEVSRTVDASQDDRLQLIKQFVWKLLLTARKNLSFQDSDFTGIPLQTKLLADVFSEELKSSLQDGVICFNDRFDLVYLYEQFVKSKTDILCAKFGKDARYSRTLFRKHQQLIALKFLFKEDQLAALEIDKKVGEFYEADRQNFLQREGLVVIKGAYSDLNVSFVHRTFAEYLSAQWVSENYSNTDYKIRITVEKLIRHRFDIWQMQMFSFFFRLFDCILARDCPLHMSVINEQTPETKRLIMSDSDIVDVLDVGGRSILHIVSLYSVDEDRYGTRYNLYKDMVQLVDHIPRAKISSVIRPDALGYNPLDYAIARRSYTIANKICEISKGIALNIPFKEKYVLTERIENCYRLSLQPLFRILLEYFVCHDILFNKTATENLKLERYCQDVFVASHVTFDNYASEVVAATIPELLERIHIKSPTESYYYDLRFAIAFGKESNVKKILMEGTNINQQDMYHNASLHYAAINKQGLIMEMLISNGADINQLGLDGNTALHFSCKAGYKSIVQRLLLYEADMEIQNNEGDTPLLVALRNEHTSIAELLISKNADVHVENMLGSCCLHYAAMVGARALVDDFIKKGVGINKQSKNGNTPLHLALENSHMEIADLLLGCGADINMENSRKETCLHYVAMFGATALADDFIKKGIGINKQSKDGNTPLHLALQYCHMEVADLLLGCGADINMENSTKQTCLHYAAMVDATAFADDFIKKGTDINKQSINGNTPLHLALENGHMEFADLLLGCGADINIENSTNDTCLHYAAMVGARALVDDFIKKGVGINKQSRDGNTPLHLALENGHMEIADLLLGCGADINIANSTKETCLHYAAMFGDTALAGDFIKKGVGINKQSRDGNTPLLIALQHRHMEVADLLLGCGADINMENSRKKTCLHYAAEDGARGLVDDFIKKGVDINKQNSDGDTPLLRAVLHRHMEVADLLLGCGADINIENSKKETCLHYAAMVGARALADDFIKRGIDINKQSSDGDTPLLIALQHRHTEVADLLLGCGADINMENDIEETCLHYAAMVGATALADDFIKKGIDINKQSINGDTPLHLALENGHMEIADLLLGCGADINMENSTKRTCLHYAAMVGARALVDDFIKRGLDINKQSSDGDTPLHLALENGHMEIADLLLGCGADINMENSTKRTCLHYAAMVGARALVDDLIKKGVDINKQSSDGDTPLLVALKNRHIKVSDLLLGCGADTSLRNSRGNGALHFAAKYACHEIINKLISLGCNVNETNDKGKTPLHKCTFSFSGTVSSVKRIIKSMKCLLKNYANVNAQDFEGHSILHRVSKIQQHDFYDEEDVAVRRFYIENATRLLLNAGADISLKNYKGKTALHLALDQNNAEFVSAINRKLLNSQQSLDGCDSLCCVILYLANESHVPRNCVDCIQRGLTRSRNQRICSKR